MLSMFDAEDVAADGFRRVMVKAGTKVAVGHGFYVIITEASIRCDCGKGVLCASNPMRRIGAA